MVVFLGGGLGKSGTVDTSGCDYLQKESHVICLFSLLQIKNFMSLIIIIISLLLQNGTQFQAEYKNYLTRSRLNVTSNNYSQQCYDATWALAYALNDTLTGETQHHKIIYS